MTLLAVLWVLASAPSTPLGMNGGLARLPSPLWTDELVEDLSIGLAALPPAVRIISSPLEIELHEEATPLGLGDATHPDFTQGLARLHLYAYREDDDPRAAIRLAKLTVDQRRRLWRRRAIVHALIRRWDERLRWSARAGWKALAGWEGDQPLLVYPWAFSRRKGMESPALDLATFAEELLVPADSMLDGAMRIDDQLRCREPSKARFLDERLGALDPSWKPSRDCPAFDAWADLEHLPKFEVLFATPSSSSAQALFGHLLLRIVREDDEGPGTVQVMQLAALISPLEPVSSYILRGLGGGFRGVFSLTSLADVHQEALGLEQRSLRRFSLELTADQRLRLLERVWELERVGYIDYRFFKANCATMLRFLLTPAMGEQAPAATLTPWEAPTQVLDGLAGALGAVEIDEPSGAIARRALAGDLASSAARRLLASLRIERYALDEATVARIKAERATVLPGWTGPTTEELVASRQKRYERETSPRRRAQAELADLLALDELMRAAPRRPPTSEESVVFAEEKRARESFDAVAEEVAKLSEAQLEGALEAERAELKAFQAETRLRAVPEGGHGHAELSGGVLSTGAPFLRLRASALTEQLGDQRLRGFGSRSAWRLLDASVELTLLSQPVHRVGFTLLNVRSLALSGWGWGAGLDYAFADSSHEVAASGEVLRVLVSDQRLTNFLIATAGARLGVRADQLVNAAAYPRGGLAVRLQLPGSFGNAVRLDGAYLPRLLAGNGTFSFEHGASAAAQLTIRLGVVGGVALTARADFRGEWRPGTGLSGLAALGLELD